MPSNKLNMEIKVEILDEVLEKAKQLNELLEKAQCIIASLSETKIKIS